MSFEQEVRIRVLEDELRLVRARLAVVNDRYCHALGALGGVGDCTEEELIEEEALATSIVESYKRRQRPRFTGPICLSLSRLMVEHEEVLDAEKVAKGNWAEYNKLRNS